MEPKQQSIKILSREIFNLVFGLKLIATTVLLIVSLGDIATTLSIDYYQNFFRDVLHGAPLPLLTELVVKLKVLLLILSFFWPLLGIGALFDQKRVRLSFILVVIALSAASLQSILISAVMQIPSLRIISSIQDRGAK